MALYKTRIVKSKYGHNVHVQHRVEIAKDSLVIIQLVALCGRSTHRKRVTLGAVDGKRLRPPTTAQLQAMLDKHRLAVADEASWKESVRVAVLGIS